MLSLLLFLSLLPLIFFIFFPRGKAVAKVLQIALEQQRITPELRAVLADSAVRAATIYEAITLAIFLGLRVLKPF